jgi:hypothetical protein
MKQFFVWITNYYNTSTPFHSLVQGVIGALVGAVSAWVAAGGSLPTSKTGWIALGAFVFKFVYAFFTRWMQQNVATVSVATK